MCQPKPGPRCSHHARNTLANKRVTRDETKNVWETAKATYRSCDPDDNETRQRLRSESIDAERSYWETQTAYNQALRVYETTPEGMNALEQAAQRFTAEGEHVSAENVYRRLTEARETRTMQIADLAMSRQYQTRLYDLTPDEQEKVRAAGSDVNELADELTSKSDEYEAAYNAWQAYQEEVRAADQIENETNQVFRATREEITTAMNEVEQAAKALYMEAGISERFAGYYANDTITATTRRNSQGRSSYRYDYNSHSGEGTPRRLAVLKVKRDGPDREKTLAAKQAAETDDTFVSANSTMMAAAEHHQAAYERLIEVRDNNNSTVREENQRLRTVMSNAKYAMEDAASKHEKADKKLSGVWAQIGSGLGVEPLEKQEMRRVRDEIVRNPDGSTNAYVYDGPSDGFQYGRYIPAIDITTTTSGMSPANALVLENGRKAWVHGHYSRTTRGAGETTTGYSTVVLTPPQEGATPLRLENIATAGYATFVDTTD